MRKLRLRVWRAFPEITQVVAARARLEPGRGTGLLSPWAHDEWAFFIFLASSVFLHLNSCVIKGLVSCTYGVFFLLFLTVNLWNGVILKSYVLWTRHFCLLCSLLPPLPSVWRTARCDQGSRPLPVSVPREAFAGPSPPHAGSLSLPCTLPAFVHVAPRALYIALYVFLCVSLFIPGSKIYKIEFFTERPFK